MPCMQGDSKSKTAKREFRPQKKDIEVCQIKVNEKVTNTNHFAYI